VIDLRPGECRFQVRHPVTGEETYQLVDVAEFMTEHAESHGWILSEDARNNMVNMVEDAAYQVEEVDAFRYHVDHNHPGPLSWCDACEPVAAVEGVISDLLTWAKDYRRVAS